MSEFVIEKIILGSLVHNPNFYTVVIPHTKSEFFEGDCNRIFFDIIFKYYTKYNSMPLLEAAEIELHATKGLTDSNFKQTCEIITNLYRPEVRDGIVNQPLTWLLDKTEKYFKDRACFLAIMESLEILDGDAKVSRESIPDILAKAVGISFNNEVGHDYFADWQNRFDEYHRETTKIPFSLHMLNKVTNGGYENGTLNLAIGGTGTGKTIMLCNEAAHLLMIGKKILYITLEMSETKISERIDAKLMGTPIDGVLKMDHSKFSGNIKNIMKRTSGQLIVQQFPPRTITTKHIESYLNDLNNKKNFVPDVIFVDYMTLLNSYTHKGSSDNMYLLGKLVAEELRGLAIRHNLAIFSASQTNRDGQGNADFDLKELGESHAISQTSDFMFGLISTTELEALGQWRIKILKSRYGSISEPSSFIVGVDKPMMTVFDIDYAPPTMHVNDPPSSVKTMNIFKF